MELLISAALSKHWSKSMSVKSANNFFMSKDNTVRTKGRQHLMSKCVHLFHFYFLFQCHKTEPQLRAIFVGNLKDYGKFFRCQR